MAVVFNSTHQFAIVHFPSDESIEIVPIGWLSPDHKKCFFPPEGTSNVKKFVKKSKEINCDWPLFESRVLQYYETYKDADTHVSTALVTSDVPGSEDKKKPKGQKPTLPVHPKTVPDPESIEKVVLNDSTNKDTVASTESTAAGANQADQNPYLVLSDLAAGETVELVLATATAKETGCTCDCSVYHTAQMVLLKSIEEKLITQAEALNSLLLLPPNQPNQIVTSSFKFRTNTFPLKTLQEVEELEKLLCENGAAFTELKAKLKAYAGGTLDDAVKSIFKFAFSDEVLAMHSLKGQSKKSSFSSYTTLCQSIFSGLQETAKFKAITVDIFEKAISNNLKRAADRESQKKKKADADATKEVASQA